MRHVSFFCRKLCTRDRLHHTGHASHATHAAHAAHGGSSRRVLVHFIDDHDFSGRHEAGNRRGVSEGSADDLGGVKNAVGGHIHVLADERVVANVSVGLLEELADDDSARDARVVCDCLARHPNRLFDDLSADLVVNVGGVVLDGAKVLGGVEKRRSAAGDDTLLDSRASSVEGIRDAIFLLADFDLAGTADLDDGDAARELGEALLELLLLVLAGGVLDRRLEEADALGDGLCGAFAVKNDSVVLRYGDLLGNAEHVDSHILEREPDVLADDLSAGHDGEVLHVGLAVVAKARRLDGDDLEACAQLVDNESRERLALDVLSDDHEGLLLLGDALEDGYDRLERGDLLLDEEDAAVFEFALLRLGVGDKIGGDESAVEAHAIDNIELVLHRFAVLDGDDARLADAIHGVRDEVSDVLVVVGGDARDLLDLLLRVDLARHGVKLSLDVVDGVLDTPVEIHGVHASSDALASFSKYRAREDGGCGGPISCNIVGLVGDLNKI